MYRSSAPFPLVQNLQYIIMYIALFLKRRQMAGGGPPRRGEGSRGSVTDNAKANAVGVGCVRCARAHLPFGLREAPAQSFVVAVGSAPSLSQR